MIAQLSHWRMASAAAVFVLAGSSAVALAMHNEPGGAYPSVSSAPAVRRGPADARTAAERAGRALLAQAVAACRTTAFSGVQVFRFWGPSGPSEWLAEIWHRPGGQVIAEPVAGSGSARDGRVSAPGPGVSMALSGQQLALLQAGYVLDYAGHGAATGRPADVVTVERPDGTLAARYWLDGQTRLPLRRQLFDDRARIVSDISFAQLRTGRASLTRMPASGAQLWPRQLDVADVSDLRTQGWPLPARLPGGMVLVAATATAPPAGQVIGVSYSDGLAVISLFVQRGTLPARMPGWQRMAIAGHDAYAVDPDDQTIAWSGDGYVFTLLADAPSASVDQAIAALPQGSQPGFLARLGRGFRRLASWANPFR